MQLVGIIGDPVSHSLSPVMHEAAFQAMGMDWRYVAMHVRGADRLESALKGVSALGFRGINVTVPHKVECLQYMDSLTAYARQIGAVNTIIVNQFTGELRGANTDGDGFLDDLRAQGVVMTDSDRVLMLGAGGAARSLIVALLSVNARITVVNRTTENAQKLADEFGVDCAPFDQLAKVTDGARLIVNATSVGLYPRVDESPWPDEVRFPPQALIYDTIYRPLETKLIRDARAQGNIALNGLGMLVHQGARSFSMWTGKNPDTLLMEAACLKQLAR